MNNPVTAIIVGAGHRAMLYSKLALSNPELLKIVGVADPNPTRRKMAMNKFGFSEDMCFESAQELAKKGKLADAVITGTMDEQHIETAIPLLNCGYDMLLEKPFAVNEEEALLLKECAKKKQLKGDDLPRSALHALLLQHKGTHRTRRNRRYYKHSDHRARQLSPLIHLICARQVGKFKKMPYHNAACKMLSRH